MLALWILLTTLALPSPHGVARQAASAIRAAPSDTVRCVEAAAFLRGTQQMLTGIDPDTLDDWRTHRTLPGCRVTAAGATALTVQREAVLLYERIRAAGWTRTPNPVDAPNEASLRFRRNGTDCLFNVTAEPLLGTDREARLNEQLQLRPGQTRYQVLALCVEALPAAPPSAIPKAP